MNKSGLKRTPSLGTIPSFGSLSISSIESPKPTSSNALNRPAQASQSLYPLCLDLLERLYCVEGFEKYLIQGQNNMPNNSSIVGTPTTENGPNNIIRNDPVTLLWQTFRLGHPLCVLFNALKPQKEAIIEETKPGTSEIKTSQKNVFHFLMGCREELKLEPGQMFTISQLYKDDTNGFVKVIDTVKLVTDKIEEKGLLELSRRQLLRNSDPMKPTDNRAKVVHELLETERKYVQDMEVLQHFARELQIQEIVSADTIHLLFANLNQLVDFQRRFLIGVEAIASQPPAEQRFGNLFVQMEENFAVYEPFCANYQSASELVIQETPNLQKLANIVEPTYVLPSLLIKPIQRICKYPLLLQELLKYSDKDETPYYDEIERGLKAIKRVADRVNETRRKQENEAVVKDLERRVEDWKGHKISQFGNLLLEDVFIMSKEDSEREYHVYLFEKILLCCKETNTKKTQSKTGPLIKGSNRKQKRASLQLKGRIFIHNITAVVNNSRAGLWSLKVFWRGDTEMESFSLKCRNEEQLNQWQSTLEKLLADFKNRHKDESVKPVTKRTQVSNTQLASLQNLDVYSRRDDDAASFIDEDEDEDDYEEEELEDDWEDNNKIKSRSLPYGQYPKTGYNGRNRPRTEDAPPPYNWSPPLPPSVPSVPPQHRSLTNISSLSRNGAPTSPSNSIHQGENASYFPNSPPPSYPVSPAQSVRSSASHSNLMGTWQRQSIEPLTDTITRFMMGNDDDYIEVQPPQRATTGQTYQINNGSSPALQQTSASNYNRLRSASSPNIQSIKEQWEELESPPTNDNVQRNNGIQSSETHQRHSGSSTSSQTSNTGNGLSSPPNGLANGTQYSRSNFSTTMKIKVNYAEDIFVIVVPQNIEYKELCDRVERKIRLCTTQRDESIPLRIKYQDEDGDHITINSDEDVLMAFEGRLAAGGNFVNLYVS
ncbi:hypothetical protein C1646_733976 [Rhizophagus diaphanus]|nr:hypothetical protein C1646_733976 [Rhizophagus diaphanus] [Rhizophagus sp. MUCL 43196]